MKDETGKLSEGMEPDAFLDFVAERVRVHGGANVMVLLECADGAFETLASHPARVWQFGMLRMADSMLDAQSKPTHLRSIVDLDQEGPGTVN